MFIDLSPAVQLVKFLQVAKLITAIHDQNIVHGSIQPRNIMSLDNKYIDMVLVDYSFSAEIGSYIRKTNRFYNPPEKIDPMRIANPDHDAFSFMITMFEMALDRYSFNDRILKGCPDDENKYNDKCYDTYDKITDEVVTSLDNFEIQKKFFKFLKERLFNRTKMYVFSVKQATMAEIINKLLELIKEAYIKNPKEKKKYR